jgi:hypothetical protein
MMALKMMHSLLLMLVTRRGCSVRDRAALFDFNMFLLTQKHLIFSFAKKTDHPRTIEVTSKIHIFFSSVEKACHEFPLR